MFENKDEENIKLFLTMNLNDELMNAIKAFVILSILEILFRENKPSYMLDLDIDANFTIDLLAKSKFLNQNFKLLDMVNMYKLVSEKYMLSDIGDVSSVSGSYYGFHPKFRFSKKVIDTYFINTIEGSVDIIFDDFIQKIEDQNIKKDNDIEAIITKIEKQRTAKVNGIYSMIKKIITKRLL
jgi:hypothetical protein